MADWGWLSEIVMIDIGWLRLTVWDSLTIVCPSAAFTSSDLILYFFHVPPPSQPTEHLVFDTTLWQRICRLCCMSDFSYHQNSTTFFFVFFFFFLLVYPYHQLPITHPFPFQLAQHSSLSHCHWLLLVCSFILNKLLLLYYFLCHLWLFMSIP